jgi:hypothetical protein
VWTWKSSRKNSPNRGFTKRLENLGFLNSVVDELAQQRARMKSGVKLSFTLPKGSPNGKVSSFDGYRMKASGGPIQEE